MDRVLALGSLYAIGVGRLILSYNFLSTMATPLLLSIIVSAATAVFGLAQLWMMASPTPSEHHIQPSMQHAAYVALDIIFLNFSLKDPSLISFVIVQLLSMFFINIMTKSTQIKFTLRNASALIIISVGCYILYATHFTFGGLPFFAAVIWSVAASDLNSISCQRRNSEVERSHLQSEIFGSIVAFVLSLLVWVNNSERLVLVNISPDSMPMLSIQAIAIGALMFGRNRLADQIPKHSIRENTIPLLVTVALVIYAAMNTTLASSQSILAAVLFALGAYFTTPAVNESHHNNIQATRKDGLSNVKTFAIIGLAFLLLAGYSSSTINSVVFVDEKASNASLVSSPNIIEEKRYDYPDIQYDISPQEIARQEQRYQCMHKTKQYIINKVTSLIVRYANFTAMDYAYNYNINDAVVWLGQERLWHIYGQFPSRMDNDWEQTNLIQFKKYRDQSMKNGTIFITGGGTMNSGLAPRVQFKIDVTAGFKYNPVVIMPDIINYNKVEDKLVQELIESFNSHEMLTVLLQDQESMDFAKKHFKTAKVMYVPDTTWMIGPTFPNSQPYLDILLLFRRDNEGTQSNSDIKFMLQIIEGQGYSAESWDFPFKGYPVFQDDEQFVWYNYSKILPNRLILPAKKEENMDIAPEYKLQIAVSLFSRAKIIVTDRLHATIIANLMDKPVIYINEKSGKNEGVRKQLTSVIGECSDSAFNMVHEQSARSAVNKAIQFIAQKKDLKY